jgi:undecaprenyl-diphosphatase
MHSLIIFGAKYLILAVVLLWIMAWLQASRHHKKQLVWAAITAVILAAILDKIASKIYYDPRPFTTHHIQPLVSHVADNGFPSEHTLFGVTVAVALIFYRPKLGSAALILALIVGVSRVAAHVHSPIDIVGAALIGVSAGYIGYRLSTRWISPKVRHGVGRPTDPKQTR